MISLADGRTNKMATGELRRSRSRPRIDTMYSQRSDSNASLNVLVSTPIADGEHWGLYQKSQPGLPRSHTFPTLPSPETSTPSSSYHDNDGDSFFLRSPGSEFSETASWDWNNNSNVNVMPTTAFGGLEQLSAKTEETVRPTSDFTSREHRGELSHLDSYIGDHSRSSNRLSETSDGLSRNGSRSAQGRPNVLIKRRRSQNTDKPIYRNSVLLQPQTPSAGVNQAASCRPVNSPYSRGLAGACPGPSVNYDSPHGLLMPRLTPISTAVSHPDTHSKHRTLDGHNSGNKIMPLSAPPSAYKGRSTASLASDDCLDLRGSHEEANSSPTASSPRIRRPSQKLTKRRPPSVAPPPVSSAALLSELSPSPLSLEEIAIAKRTFESVPPPVPPLPDYLRQATGRTRPSLRELADNEAPTKRWNRLSLRELADREEMAEALPSARPRTLFSLPSTSQKWKTRRINFLSSVSTPAMPTSNQTRASTGTDKLASFAWTGVILPSPESSTEESHTEFINSPPQVGHPVEERMSHIELKRGWTLAMAMADDGVTDEVLVEELEKMRRKSGPEQQYRLSRTWMRQSPPKPGHTRSATTTNASEGTVHLQLHDLNRATSIDVSDAEEAATWHIARRALLCCREIVRTEKRYQEELKALLDGDTLTAPPAVMLTYLPALIRASENLLKGLSQDPSAWGVSTAFMTCEDELESAMVAWSGVAGQFFAKKRKSWRRSSHQNLSISSNPPVLPSHSSPLTLNLLNSSTVFFPALGKYDNEKGEKSSESGEGVSDDRGSDKVRRSERRVSVRDLAIQPTQRVVRYVMLYRDLLAHTPHTSPSRALVERALEVAQRIASKCDRAQDNAAFLQPRPRRPSTAPSARSSFLTFMSSTSVEVS